MQIFYKLPFRKFVKKQRRPFQLVIEDEVEKIADNLDIGQSKKGDLRGFRVHKFSYFGQKFLIAYRFQETQVVFFTVGPHENFYRELKKYLKEVRE